jgi:sugar-specific transcriptional regulator TrmB
MTPLIKKLSALGLPTKDAATYVALLKLESATVQQISSETGLNRSSLYVILDRLSKRGLVSFAGGKGVRKYAAAPPERLALFAREQAEKSALLFQNLATLSPVLQSTHKESKFKPKVVVVEGKEGLRKGFDDALKSEEKIMRVFSSTKDIFKSLPGYLPIFVMKRMIRGIKMYGIHPDDETSREMLRRIPNSLDEITLVPPEKFRFPSDMAIYDNKVAFTSHDLLFGASVESKEIAEVMKIVFDLAQLEARRFRSQI